MLNIKSNHIPQNDQELNLCVQAMNRAYSKYFNFPVGSSKSNKLRDCFCESIGFTNGGYQQLQVYWAANKQYDFSDINLAIPVIFEFYGGYNFNLAAPIASQVINYLCEHFPNDHEGFLSPSEMSAQDIEPFDSNSCWEEYGWDLLWGDEEHQKTITDSKNKGEWFPLYYGKLIIGFAFSRETQTLINGLLLSCFADNGIDFNNIHEQHKENKSWFEYVECNNKKNNEPTTGKYVSLRVAGCKSSLFLPFDELIIDEGRAILNIGGEEIVIEYHKDSKTFNYENLMFDFMSAYDRGAEKTLSLIYGEVDLGGTFNFFGEKNKSEVEFIELFCYDRLEYRLKDEDDEESYNHLEGAAFLIK